MSGTAIIGALLLADTDLLAEVSAGNIKAGQLPDGVALPALLVRTVSGVERLKLRRVGYVRTVERIAVTVRAANYRSQEDIIDLIRAACAGKTGTIAGLENVSVQAAGTGPDIIGPGNSFEQTQDFSVGFDEPV